MIRFDDVTKTYLRGTRPALENLTLEFPRGEFVFLVGASGSGKSTLMRLVLKETLPTRGTVYVAGKDLSRIPSWRVPALRREIGMVFQDFRLLPSKTAAQNIEFALAVIGTPRRTVRRLVPEMLELVGLADKGRRYPHELSGGEQQRVAIARAYVNRPTILLADEPTGNLDPTTSEGILDLLTQINERGTTVVMATHDQGAVDRMRRRVVELVGGRVVRDDEQGTYDGPSAPPTADDARDATGERAAGQSERIAVGAEERAVDSGDTETAAPARPARRIRPRGGSRALPVAEDIEDEELLDRRDAEPDVLEDAFTEDAFTEDSFTEDDPLFLPETEDDDPAARSAAAPGAGEEAR